MMIPVKNVGAIGVIKDASQSELPINAWTDASNIRFLNGDALQFYGHSEVYNSPSYVPQHLLPITLTGTKYWIYQTASKSFVVTNSGGVAVHTDITHTTPRTGVVNQWTGFDFQGVPVFNAGDLASVPMYWDLNITHKFVDLTNWPASTYVKVLRKFKGFIIGLYVKDGTGMYPYMMMWSHEADPGSLPSSYDPTDTTKDAGNMPIPDGDGEIVDGGQLKDSFIVYKERSAHRIDYVGGVFVLSQHQIFGMLGAMNRNCWAEFDGTHLVLTTNDVVIHDGYTAQSVLDNKARRFLFQNMDDTNKGNAFVFKNPFLNEIFVAYPSIGSTACDKALVYNYKDQTVTFRTLPNLNHAAYGGVDNTLGTSWGADADSWDSDLTVWNGPDFTPGSARVIMASTDQKLYMLDGSASFNGVAPSAYLERRALPLASPDRRTLITSIRPIIYGNTGQTVTVKIGGHDTDPTADPTWDSTMTFTIGTTISCDGFSDRRYPAIRFESGTAYQWRLASYLIDATDAGAW
jgi:hypothetical protein